jgi:predicted CXXCH cytochrome family protein
MILLRALAFLSAAVLLHGQAGDRANAKLCAGCHAGIYASYRQTGMGRSFYRPAPGNTVEDYTRNNRYFHAASDTRYEMLQRDGKYFQRRFQAGYDGKETNVEEKQIDYVMGSGNHARTYLHRAANGGLVELPLAWYAEKGGYWAMNPGYDTLFNPGAGRAIGYECMFCHNAYPNIPAGQDRFAVEPVYSGELPEGIDCQRCHGPTARHIELARTAGSRPADIGRAVVNPARLPAERQMEVCMQCHLEPTSFRLPHAIRRYERGAFSYNPGEPLAAFMMFFDEAKGGEREDRLEIASSAYRLRKSACFLKSNGALKCTSCHNPHDVPHGERAAEHYTDVCRQCHAAALQRLVAASQHPPGAQCIECHMPKRRTEDVVHVVVTDHFIQRTKPDRDLLADLPERQETDANAYQGTVLPYYPATAADPLYLAVAQVRDKSNLAKGIPQLTRILEATRPRRPEPWFELAEALRGAKQFSKATLVYRESLRRDPSYLPALLGLGNALKNSGHPAQAVEIFKRAGNWNQVGQIEIDLGHAASAGAALQKAVELQPDMPEPRNGLGILHAQSGDLVQAEADFREGIRMLPSYGEAHGNLANLLSGKQDFAQATYEFEQAIHLLPNDAPTRFNFGAMLNGLRRFDDAQQQLEAAVAANSNFAEAHGLLGNLYERKGQLDDALREYRAAVQFRPELGHAQLDLGAVLAKKGDVPEAVQHLKKAAADADPNLRRIALQLLEELGAGK